jgi:ankyrin repeat protein
MFIILFRHVNPNTKGKDGWTALEIASTSGIVDMV